MKKKTFMQEYEVKFQSLIVWSCDPEASSPLLSQTRPLTELRCPLIVATQLPFVTFHIFISVDALTRKQLGEIASESTLFECPVRV